MRIAFFFKSTRLTLALALSGPLMFPGAASAATFDYTDVLLVINDNSAASVSIGNYFKTARGIADSNVVHIQAPTTEQVSSADFTSAIRTPIENFLTSNGLTASINYIVLTKGVPIRIAETTDSVDSSLTMILGSSSAYVLSDTVLGNPYHNKTGPFSRAAWGIYLVTRLDGYTVADVTALIDRSANTTTASTGNFVLDVDPTRDNPSYQIGNTWIRSANTILTGRGYPTIFDETTTYLTNKSSVLGYYSWGSNDANDLNNGKPANTYLNGAIAETIVSTSARTFTAPATYGQSLIADLIAEGVSGAKGYVAEPYLSAIAHADILFDRYTNGYNLAESFYAASTHIGWKDLVVGDPKMIINKTPRDFYQSAPAHNALTTSVRPTFSWDASMSYYGIAKYQLYVDGALVADNISGTSAAPNADLASGSHTWFVRAIDTNGNTEDTATRTINVNPEYASPYTFTVDNVAGSDANPGTSTAPWATLAKATSTVHGGDTVIIIRNENVPYRETLSAVAGYATEAERITFRGLDAAHKPEIWGSDDVSSGWTAHSGGAADTYKRTLSSGTPSLFFTGVALSSDLTKRTLGGSANALAPGEWFFSSGTIYYRLASGESLASFHAEASVRNAAIDPSQYRTYKDIATRYAPTCVGLSSFSIAQRIDARHCDSGILGYGSAQIKSSLATGNSVGITVFGGNNSVLNSTSTGNTQGITFFVQVPNTVFRNNIITNSTTLFDFSNLWVLPITNFSASHNNWQGTAGATWDTYKGANNRENLVPGFLDSSGGNFSLDPYSENIDAGTGVNLETDIVGNPIYGAPDIGAYEYQPPLDMASDRPSDSSVVRVYGDGKFRTLSSPATASTVPLSVTPTSANRLQWLDLAVSQWTAGVKEWSESSSTVSGNTTHTVRELDPNTYYEIAVDTVPGQGISGLNCSSTGMCLSSSTGAITFSYSGGYSSHTFTMTARPDATPLLSNGAPSGIVSAGTTSVLLSLSTLEASTCRYAMSPSVDYDDMPGIFSSTGTTTHSTTLSGLSSDVAYVYYVKCLSSAGNIAGDYGISFSIARTALEEELDIDSPRVRFSTAESFDLEEEANLRERKMSLSATMPEIARGSVEVFRNGGLYKTIPVDAEGYWSDTIRVKEDGEHQFRIVYKDSHGTEVSSQRKRVFVDTKKPEFQFFPKGPLVVERGVTKLEWGASDNDRIKRYKIYFSGRIYTRADGAFIVPSWAARGQHTLLVRAIDRAGNKSERSVPIIVR